MTVLNFVGWLLFTKGECIFLYLIASKGEENHSFQTTFSNIIMYIFSLPQVKHHKDIVGLLPDNLALNILQYLSPKELLVAGQVRAVNIFFFSKK